MLRWDGYQFRAYTANTTPDDGLRNHYVQALHVDREGRLWVGTASGGLARYDAATDRFRLIALGDQPIERTGIWSLDDDGSGGLWVGTSLGLAHLDERGRIVAPMSDMGLAKSSVFALPGRKVEAVVRSRSGTLWVGSDNGLAEVDADGRVKRVSLPAADGAAQDVSQLMEDSAGRIWAGTRYHGAYVIDPATLNARAVPVPPELLARDDRLEIMGIEEVENGRVWLATHGHGILDVDAGRMTVRSIVRDPAARGSLDSNLVNALYRDRSGVTWISTFAALDQFVPPAGGIQTLLGDPSRQGGTPTDVTAVMVRPDGDVWLGSQHDGIQVLGSDGKALRTLPVSRVFCLAAAAQGPVYIGTRTGLFEADPDSYEIRKVQIPSRRPNESVLSLTVIDGTLWVGGGDDDGLWELHPVQDGALTVVHHYGMPSLPNATVRALELAPDGRLAIGTSYGMGLLDRVTGKVEHILPDLADPRRIGGGLITSFVVDRHARLWVGSDDSGIAVMLGRDASGHGIFRRITTATGLPDADIGRMLTDEDGKIWASTDNGLAVIDPDKFTVQSLRDADGVAITLYWAGSGDRTPRGDLLFGGAGGLTVVRPGELTAWRYRPPLAVSEIHLGGKLVRSRTSQIIIKPKANSLAVEFSALDLSSPDENLYRYKLEGFDHDFIVTDARHRVATYTNLSPGRYRLLLQGSNRNGVWADPIALEIRVTAAWYETKLVRLTEMIALLSGTAGIIQGRTIWLRRRQSYLEKLVRDRTAELVCSQQKLTQLAYLDPLTTLPNRRSFNNHLDELLASAQRRSTTFALLLIDLDGFKGVNDTLGHDAGDLLLVAAANRLRGASPPEAIVARLGGDEFAILVTEVDGVDLETMCHRVVTSMTEPISVGGDTMRVGASVGAAIAKRHGETAAELYKRADQALYGAKRAGKGTWCADQVPALADC